MQQLEDDADSTLTNSRRPAFPRFPQRIQIPGTNRADRAESLLLDFIIPRERAGARSKLERRTRRLARNKGREKKETRKRERGGAPQSKTLRDNRPYLRLAAFDAIFCSSGVPFILASLLELS
jgi:hypothetical protein